MTPKEIDSNLDLDKYIVLRHVDDPEKLYVMTKEEYARIKTLSRKFDFNYQNVPDGNFTKVMQLKWGHENKYQLIQDSVMQDMEINILKDAPIWLRNQ